MLKKEVRCIKRRIGPQSVKKVFFDRLTEVEEAAKTRSSFPKCMWILERGELRSKSKCLA